MSDHHQSETTGRLSKRQCVAAGACVLLALALPAGASAAATSIPSGPVSPANVPTTRIKVPHTGTKPVAPAPGNRVKTTPAAPGTSGVPAAPRRSTSPATPSGGVAPVTPRAPVTPVAPLAPRTPAARTTAPGASHRGGGLSTAAIVLAAAAGLIALACLAWALARMLAFEPHWSLSARHVMAEAEFRASATWDEFTDWIRLGR